MHNVKDTDLNITSPNFRFDTPSFLTKNGILNIVNLLGRNTKNLDTQQWVSAHAPRAENSLGVVELKTA